MDERESTVRRNRGERKRRTKETDGAPRKRQMYVKIIHKRLQGRSLKPLLFHGKQT